jgi:hypothetical protein
MMLVALTRWGKWIVG